MEPMNWFCPKCGKSYFSDSVGTTTLVYYPPIWKDGININPDRNTTSFTRHCYECGASFLIQGCDVGGYKTTEEK